jgi:hypothetical protein
MPSAWLELDRDLRRRVQEVLADPRRPVTEPELRKLTDEGRACSLILHGELQRLEGRLGRIDGDPSTSLGAIADAFRRVHEFRAHVDGLDEVLAALDQRAREVRSAWRQQAAGQLP